ncbi:hypothetical protein PIB30_095568, partial [Stylosanthes scabra]|nr:hypothetical protein [Stylosanthes scabra]
MCRNIDIAELKATTSKSLIDKLKMFEINRRKLAKSHQIYGMQEVSSPNKEADLPSLGAAQDKGNKGFLEINHEVIEEEEVKQSKVAWTEPQSNPGSKLGHVWTRLAQAPKHDPIKDVPRLPTLILSH